MGPFFVNLTVVSHFMLNSHITSWHSNVKRENMKCFYNFHDIKVLKRDATVTKQKFYTRINAILEPFEKILRC